MPIKALAPWFGGKRNLAPVIIEELGDHRSYWEPFCGSMAVLLAKPPATMETVNDLHGDLINMAKVIQDRTLGPLMYRSLRRTLMHEDIYRENDLWMREHEADAIAAPDIERAVRYFIVSWLGRNGTAGTPVTHKGTYCVRFTHNGGHGATRFRSCVNSIPAWRRRLERATILRRVGIPGSALVAAHERPQPRPHPPTARPGVAAIAAGSGGSGGSGGGDLPTPQVKILASLAWWASAGVAQPSRHQAAFVAGYTVNGHFNNSLGSLKSAGLVDYPAGGSVALTQAGAAMAPPAPRPLTRDELIERVRQVLKAGPQQRLFDALVQADGDRVPRDQLAAACGYTVNGHFNNVLGATA